VRDERRGVLIVSMRFRIGFISASFRLTVHEELLSAERSPALVLCVLPIVVSIDSWRTMPPVGSISATKIVAPLRADDAVAPTAISPGFGAVLLRRGRELPSLLPAQPAGPTSCAAANMRVPIGWPRDPSVCALGASGPVIAAVYCLCAAKFFASACGINRPGDRLDVEVLAVGRTGCADSSWSQMTHTPRQKTPALRGRVLSPRMLHHSQPDAPLLGQDLTYFSIIDTASVVEVPNLINIARRRDHPVTAAPVIPRGAGAAPSLYPEDLDT